MELASSSNCSEERMNQNWGQEVKGCADQGEVKERKKKAVVLMTEKNLVSWYWER